MRLDRGVVVVCCPILIPSVGGYRLLLVLGCLIGGLDVLYVIGYCCHGGVGAESGDAEHSLLSCVIGETKQTGSVCGGGDGGGPKAMLARNVVAVESREWVVIATSNIKEKRERERETEREKQKGTKRLNTNE